MDKDKRVKGATQKGSSDLERMVRRIKPTATWEQLDCSQSTLTKLRNICSDFNYGKNNICLFSGPSGTVKIQYAEVLAKQLRLGLFRIDLSIVVSKFIGETEKNLDKVFSAVDECDMVLFFDEADTLFGDRSAVTDRHDRYGNIAISSLLLRMQAHPGLAILATNKQPAVDPGFQLRFRRIIIE